MHLYIYYIYAFIHLLHLYIFTFIFIYIHICLWMLSQRLLVVYDLHFPWILTQCDLLYCSGDGNDARFGAIVAACSGKE